MCVTTTYVNDEPTTQLASLDLYAFYRIPGENTVYRVLSHNVRPSNQILVLNLDDLKIENTSTETIVEEVDINDIRVEVEFA